jgi:hypothetical protein
MPHTLIEKHPNVLRRPIFRVFLPAITALLALGFAEFSANAADSKKPKNPGLVMDYGPFLCYSVEKSRPGSQKPAAAPADNDERPAVADDPDAERATAPAEKPKPTTKPAKTAKKPAAVAPKTELVAAKGITIKVGPEATVCFDADLMRFAAGWTGGFLDLAKTNIGSYKGSLAALEEGVTQFRTGFGPGWSAGEKADFTDPRPDGEGPMPQSQARYGGLYRHGEQVVLSYTVGNAKVLDLPASVANGREAAEGGHVAFTRTIRVDGVTEPLHLLICDVEKGVGHVSPSAAAGAATSGPAAGNVAVVTYKDSATLVSVAKAPAGATLEVTAEGRVVLHLPAGTAAIAPFKVSICNLPAAELKDAEKVLKAIGTEVVDPATLCRGGPSLWKESIATAGSRGVEDDKVVPYVVDTIRLPDDNPWHAWVRPGGFDFFPDGRIALATMNGDVWIGTGIDDSLQHVSWRRFATGMYEPLGLKVVDGLVYVLGRDQITRLHDLDGDGEADFYENFNNDFVTLPVYHAFTFDLQTDRAGNFYFVRGGNWVKPGERDYACSMKVSKDGKYIEQLSHGLRAPNGDGMGPNDEFVCGDNEGHWTPACRINLLKPGGFYGYVIDPRQVTPENASKVKQHDTYDPPICWIPMSSDNSTGGQVWVTSDKWGPLQSHMLSTSYGKCALYEVIYEETDGIPQGATIKLPLKFDSGIMRARFSPADGQLYVAGLKGWQTAAAHDGGLQRVRYTGKPLRMPVGIHVKHNGIQIDFSCPLDPEAANDEQSYAVEQWNYRWTSTYGSPEVKVSNPKAVGHDTVTVKSAKLSADGKSVFLEIPDIKPVMQMGIEMDLKSADKAAVKWTIYNTINKVPGG